MSLAAPLSAAIGVCRLAPPSGGFDPLALHRLDPRRYPFVLESSAGAAAQGRYDIVFAVPSDSLRLERGVLHGPGSTATGDFLGALDGWYKREHRASAGNLPFAGGWFLYLGYELAGQIEPRLRLPPQPDGLPTALAVRCHGGVLRDRRDDSLWATADNRALLPGLAKDVARAHAPSPRKVTVTACVEDASTCYRDGVARIREYIRAGDVFQVNLSREWRATLGANIPPAAVYAALRRSNPAPFSGLMRWRGAAVISSSPERLLRLRDGWAQTRPIAGTRPRRGADAAMTRELITHPKERAEHVMLIDLERNDLGRVCAYGSVAVDELMTVESYAHVHHIVSNVRGRLRPGVGPGAALRAVFPGGTITGCPKVRCMEIVAELEGVGRGAYTGAFGYLGLDGTLDSNILIRSLVQRGRDVSFRAGAGIVADSDPDFELAETRAKARGMLLALGAAT